MVTGPLYITRKRVTKPYAKKITCDREKGVQTDTYDRYSSANKLTDGSTILTVPLS